MLGSCAPLCGLTRVHGFSDTAEPYCPHENGQPVLPSGYGRPSALRITRLSMLNSPAHVYLYRRFVWPLARLNARLEGKSGSLRLLFTGLSPAVHSRVSLAHHMVLLERAERAETAPKERRAVYRRRRPQARTGPARAPPGANYAYSG